MTSKELAWIIRRHVFEMMHVSCSSHIGSNFSLIDFTSYLFNEILKPNPKEKPQDHFILSKGHASAAYYALLAEFGFFDRKELLTYDQDGSMLSGHVSHHVPGIRVSTGSLGHGASIASGMAYALKKDNLPGKIFVVIGDGECDEGSIWEMLLFSAQYQLDNFVIIVDRNKMQSMDFTENTIKLESLVAKFKAFNVDVIEADGHDFNSIANAFNSIDYSSKKPHVIVMNTIKGKGISYMENDILWHYRYPHDGKEYNDGLKELLKAKPSGLVSPYESDNK